MPTFRIACAACSWASSTPIILTPQDARWWRACRCPRCRGVLLLVAVENQGQEAGSGLTTLR